jgi:phospholipase/carboxylesterase
MPTASLDFVHEFVPGTSGRTLLLLHGTGGNEHDMIPIGRRLDPSAALLSPRGKVLENGMPRFFRRLAEGVFDLEDLEKRTHELADFIGAAAVHYGLASDKMIAVGYSNGANIASSLCLRRPGLIRAAILFRAMVPFTPDELPDLSSLSVLFAEGNQDPIVSTAEAERLAALFRQARANVTLHFANAGHGLVQADVETAKSWMEKLTL